MPLRLAHRYSLDDKEDPLFRDLFDAHSKVVEVSLCSLPFYNTPRKMGILSVFSHCQFES